ncbi:MAG: hypothetical protein PF513_07275 [Tenericutes bacterium]|jgi:hypothetical protein|nr:hypothetical protein [Mycoplasmatota bacterium]
MIIKNHIKIIISFVLIAILAITIYLISDRSDDDVNTGGEPQGEIYFELYDEFQTLVIDETLSFYEEDNLFTLLNRNYDLVCANGDYEPDDSCSYRFLYGRIILGIEEVDSDWYSTVLSVYINDNLSTKGVSLTELSNGDNITIRKSHINE